MTLSPAQAAILAAAADHPARLAAPPPRLAPAPRTAVAKALLGAGPLARIAGSKGKVFVIPEGNHARRVDAGSYRDGHLSIRLG
jgi:hypothetical protein